jgi:hypothetical protein
LQKHSSSKPVNLIPPLPQGIHLQNRDVPNPLAVLLNINLLSPLPQRNIATNGNAIAQVNLNKRTLTLAAILIDF